MNRLLLSGSIFAFMLFAGCCGMFEEGGECVGETVITINNQTRVCYEGNMTSSCDTEGEIYKQDLDEKVVCANGKWVKQNITSQPSTVINTSNQTSSDSGDSNSCIGKGFVTANNVTKACVNGKWTTDCTKEGEVYDESEFLEVKIVCENGHWVSKPFKSTTKS